MKTLTAFFLTLAACAGTRIIDAPIGPPTPPAQTPQPGPEIVAEEVQPSPDVLFETVKPGLFRHLETNAIVFMVVLADGDLDGILDARLRELREAGQEADGLKFFMQGSIIRWTSPDKKTRGRICARQYPDVDSPVLLIFEGKWPIKDDSVLSRDFDILVKNIRIESGRPGAANGFEGFYERAQPPR